MRYTRAARVLAKNDKISMKELADRAFMSETTAARCLEAWNACVAALIELGRLPDPATKKAPPKTKSAPVAKPAATETTATSPSVEPVGTTAI
ncbi:MAG TPA: winged helix-turn-helix domain-containing protein [Acidobacteriaceae bacterium]